MNHLNSDILVPYLDGELSAEEMTRCRTHLDACPSCRDEAERLTEVWGLLDAAPEQPAVPEGFAAAVVARASEEASREVGEPSRRSLLRRIAVPLAAAAAAAAVALLVFYRPGPSDRAADPMPTGKFAVGDRKAAPPSPTSSDIELILENREVLDVMQEYPDLIEHYDLLRAVDRALQDEQITL